jgi:nucleoside-diphosphate-sugar epimerase
MAPSLFVPIVGGTGDIGSPMVALLLERNAAGADPAGRLGEGHEPETRLIPLALAAARGRLPHLSVLGRDDDTPDGTCIRDDVHVADLAEAHWLALKYLHPDLATLIAHAWAWECRRP